MKPLRKPVRLLIEILGVCVLSQGAVMLTLPAIAPGLGDGSRAILSAALLVLLAGPMIYWRCMAVTRAREAAGTGQFRGNGGDPASTSGSIRSAVAMTALAQVLGLGLTAACVTWQQRSIAAATQDRFARGADRIEGEVRRHFARALSGLNGLRGLFAVQGDVSREGFRTWVQSRDLATEFPGVRGFGFIQPVLRGDLERFVAAERAGGSPGFTVGTVGDARDLFIVRFVEPLASNRPALGLDVGREAVRREAAEQAVDSGLPTLSGRITLPQDSRQGAGLLYLLPVYRGGALPADRDGRRHRLQGLLYTPIVAVEIMQGVTDIAEGALEIELFEGSHADAARLLFDSRAGQRPRPEAAFQSTRSFTVGGRTLALRVASGAAFEAAMDRSTVAFTAVGGALASFLMALAVWLLAVGRVRAQKHAQHMTADLARLARVVQHTSNSVTITDADLRIVWVNAGFTRITGYTLDEAAGRTPDELLGSGMAHPATMQSRGQDDGDGDGEQCRVEVLNRAKDGREYWTDTEVQPTRDATGRLTGFMEIGTDITAQKSTRLQLEAALRETDALLRTLHRHAIVSVADRKGRIVEVNDAFCAISGYSRDELLGQDHRIVNSGVHPAAFWVAMWRMIASGSSWRGEICNRARDGSLYWVDSMIAPFIGADGQTEKYISIRTDISASRATQQRLTEMADRLTLAIEGGNDGLWDWRDVNTDAVWWSPSFYALLGWQPEELAAGRSHFASLLLPTQVEIFDKAVAAALAGHEGFDNEFLLRTRSDGYRWFRSRAKVYRDAEGRATRMAGSLQDIHDRRQAERELGRERQRLGHILEGTHVGTWEWNVETGETHFNERWAEISGLGLADLGATTLQTWTDSVHADDRSRSAALLAAHFNGELPHYECETRVQHAAGHCVWVLDRGKLVSRGEDGSPRWMAGTRMDITQRKEAEQALRASEAFLDRAGRIAGVGGWLVDLASGGITWSAQTCRIHEVEPGYRPTMKKAISFYAPAARKVMAAAVQDGMDHGRPWDLELPFVTAKGRAIWVRAVGEVEFENGKPARLIGAFQDITERRALDNELREGHELMAGVLENLPCGLSVFDKDLRLMAHNGQFRQLMNLPDRLFEDGRPRFETFVRFSAERGEYGQGETGPIVEAVIARARDGGVQLFERERPNDVPLEVRRAPMPGGGIVTTYTDISARKQAEVLLKEALTRAEQASVTKSQFLANMSHEIRTPMNAILGMLSLLQKTALTVRQADYAAKTEGAARSLLGLLNDILDFSKADAGKMALDPRPFQLDRLLRDLSVILSANVGSKTIDVLFDIDPAVPPHLVGDDMRLQQVLINLGGNAIKFTGEGEVVLSVRLAGHAAVDDKPGVLLDFAVRDSGIGIAPEHQARIFTGFSQAEASTTRRFGGTGLGLAICQRLVALMGGELGLRSEPGAGSTFHFRIGLPLADEGAGAATAGLPRQAPVPLRALIVDDNASARDVFVGMAQSLGWQADAAASGAEAIALVSARATAGVPYEAAFVDWQMPEMDGWATTEGVLQAARQAGAQPPLVVMITGHGPETLARRSSEEQARLSGFLVKPVTASMLADAVADARHAQGGNAAEQTAPGRAAAEAPGRRLAGMRLLVVEDNPNNQQVAQELLGDEGAEVTLAANGQLGIEAVLAARPLFHAVLMDMQMPVMDGYTATARIRQHFDSAALPIIAMTANAMASDREACLAAGMNDHVGKPFDLAHLVAALLRHTGRPAVPMRAESAVSGTLPDALLQSAARRGIALAGAVGRMGGKHRVYLRTLQSFARDLPTLMPQLVAHLRQGRREPARDLAHTFKGLAATLGIEPLARLAGEAEKQLAAGPAAGPDAPWVVALDAAVQTGLPDIAHLAQALQEALPALEPAALAGLSETSQTGQAGSSSDTQALRLALDELSRLLGHADMRALEVFEQMQRRHAAGTGAALQALDDALAELDFDQALVRCRTLKESLTP